MDWWREQWKVREVEGDEDLNIYMAGEATGVVREYWQDEEEEGQTVVRRVLKANTEGDGREADSRENDWSVPWEERKKNANRLSEAESINEWRLQIVTVLMCVTQYSLQGC